MKKYSLLLLVFIGILLFSCSKRYICTCDVVGTTDVEVYEIYNSKKKSTKNCNARSSLTRACTLEAY
jgi:hypothetical protein